MTHHEMRRHGKLVSFLLKFVPPKPPAHWVRTLVFSASLFLLVQWPFLWNWQRHGGLYRVFPLSLIGLLTNVVNGIFQLLIIWGGVAVFSGFANRFQRPASSLTAPHRFGRGLQRIGSWIAVGLAYVATFYGYAVLTGHSPLLFTMLAIALFQYPLYQIFKFLGFVRTHYFTRDSSPRGAFVKTLDFFVDIRRLATRIRTYLFEPSDHPATTDEG